MNKGLKIENGCFINLNSIDMWWCEDTQITIEYADCIGAEALKIRIKDQKNSVQTNTYDVEVNEFHRIKREIEQYMGTQQEQEGMGTVTTQHSHIY